MSRPKYCTCPQGDCFWEGVPEMYMKCDLDVPGAGVCSFNHKGTVEDVK